jgi:transcriptional regulator GlxA family with amidase domain
VRHLPFVFAALFAFSAAPAPESPSVGASEGRLTPPAKGTIPVAFVLTEGAVMIDFAGPWEVFEGVHVDSRGTSMEEQMPFELYTVSDSRKPIHVSGGMQVIPDHTFDDAPAPRVVVIPAQGGHSPKMLGWIRKMTTQADVVMSVCTGAFKLAATGVLKGKKATTHHGSYDRFQKEFPDVLLQRNMRYVRSDSRVFTAGGLSSGIDLALHVVDLYFGRDVAEKTAAYLEYEGKGWTGDGSAATPDASSAPASR